MSDLKDSKPIVIVRWGDAWSNNGRYYTEGDDFTPIEVRSVGYLMEQNDETLVVCSDYFDSDEYRKVTSIPIVNIIEIIELDIEL